MTKITQAQIENVLQSALEAGRQLIPKDKGNLSLNATLIEDEGGGHWLIYISGDGTHGIAPYAPFTNEPWLSQRWNGKQNPNEGWWDRFVDFIVNYIQTTLGGEVEHTTGDIEE